MKAGILGEESIRGEILIEVRLIEQISWSLEGVTRISHQHFGAVCGELSKKLLLIARRGVKQVKSNGDRRK